MRPQDFIGGIKPGSKKEIKESILKKLINPIPMCISWKGNNLTFKRLDNERYEVRYGK